MDQIIQRVFRYRSPDPAKLEAFGFSGEADGRYYETEILDGQFRVRVRGCDNAFSACITECETDEPYMLHLVESAEGSFVGGVRSAYEALLEKIAAQCCYGDIFKSGVSKAVISVIREKYGDELEFLWDDEDAAIWRRKDTGKWYGVLMTVSRRKLGFDSDEIVEVIDLKMLPEELERRVDGVRILRGYHMNKNHWISIVTDGSVPLGEIEELIEKSYSLAGKKVKKTKNLGA